MQRVDECRLAKRVSCSNKSNGEAASESAAKESKKEHESPANAKASTVQWVQTLNFAKIKQLRPLLADVPPVSATWQFFKSFPGCIKAFVPENFLCNRRTLNFAKIKKLRPVFSEYSSGR